MRAFESDALLPSNSSGSSELHSPNSSETPPFLSARNLSTHTETNASFENSAPSVSAYLLNDSSQRGPQECDELKSPETVENSEPLSESNNSESAVLASDQADSEDDYISSEDDFLGSLEVSDNQNRHLTYGSGIAEHTAYFEKSLNDALDLVALDSSLAMQAQLSGQLNDKSKLLSEKQAQILASLSSLKALYKQYITENELGELEKDIECLASRIGRLKHGSSGSLLFRKNSVRGVVDRYPVEFNRARDKVLERSSD